MDEYATKAFKSDCRKQRTQLISPPNNPNEIKYPIQRLILDKKLELNRIKPYPPIFNRIPASSIEPETGASTCAFGNHKCTP
jgi:hypothetical protein